MIYHHEDGRYAEGDLSDLEEVVTRAIRSLKTRTHEWHSIAVTGISGLLVGAPVALALGKPLVVLRKPNEETHSYRKILNIQNAGRDALFLDDLMDSGETLFSVEERLREQGVAVVARYLYKENQYRLNQYRADQAHSDYPDPSHSAATAVTRVEDGPIPW